MDMSAALPIFVVTLREGFEAALVVGIVLACLNQAQQLTLKKWVYGGIALGMLGSVALGFCLWQLLQRLGHSDNGYGPLIQEILVTGFNVGAIAMLSWMLVWMTRQAKSLKSNIETELLATIQNDHRGAWGVLTLVFVAVIREGFETVLFITAQFTFQWQGQLLGAIAGLGVAVLLGIGVFRLGIRLNLGLFFQAMGLFLLLIVGGLVISTLKHGDGAIALLSQLPQYQYLCPAGAGPCWLGQEIWDGSQFLPDGQFPGIVLKALLGYREHLYLGQAIAYGTFLLSVGGLYLGSVNGEKTQGPAKNQP